MATLHISDELDRRIREAVGDEQVERFVEQALSSQLDFCEEDSELRAIVDEQIRESERAFAAGEGIELLEGMRRLAREKNIRFDR